MIYDYVMWMSNINLVLSNSIDDIKEIVPIGFAEESAKNIEHSFSRTRSHRQGSGYLDHPQIINIQKYRLVSYVDILHFLGFIYFLRNSYFVPLYGAASLCQHGTWEENRHQAIWT